MATAQAEGPNGDRQAMFLHESTVSERSRFQRCCGPLGQGSQRASVLALATTAFGSGLLALPWVFAQLGVVLGFSMLIFSGFVSLLSQRLLANAAYATGLNSYASITKKALGSTASLALDIIIFVFTFGSVAGYLVFIGQLGPHLCKSLHLPSWLWSDLGETYIILILSIFPLTPICMLRSLAKLRYATLASVISLFLAAALIIGAMPSDHVDLMRRQGSLFPAAWWFEPHIADWRKFPAAMAVCFYSFCCHVNLFAKYRELDAPTSSRVNKVLVRSVVLEVVVYAFIGLCGFLALGPPCGDSIPSIDGPSCTPLNVLASPRFGGVVGVMARICMLLTLLVAVPLNVAAGRDVLEQRIISWQTGEEIMTSPAASPTSSPSASPRTSRVEIAPPAPQAPRPQLSFISHLALSLGFLYLAALTGIIGGDYLSAILSILGGFCAVTFMFTIPIAASLRLYFTYREPDAVQASPRPGILGRRRAPGTDQIGSFFGVTKRGMIVTSVITAICICLGYLSAVLALIGIVTGKSS